MHEKIQQEYKNYKDEQLSDISDDVNENVEEDDEITNEIIQQAESLQNHTYSELTSCLELLKSLKDQIDNKHIKSASLLLLLHKISINRVFTLTHNQLIIISRLSGFLLEGIINISDIRSLIKDTKIVLLFESITQEDLDYVNENLAEYVRPLKSSIQDLDWSNIQKSLNITPKVPSLDLEELSSLKSQPKTAATALPDAKSASALEGSPRVPKFHSGRKSCFHLMPPTSKSPEDDLTEQTTPRVHFS